MVNPNTDTPWSTSYAQVLVLYKSLNCGQHKLLVWITIFEG